MDLFGPVNVKSITGDLYCLVVTDDYSRYSWVFFQETKDETFENLMILFKKLENLYHCRYVVFEVIMVLNSKTPR